MTVPAPVTPPASLIDSPPPAADPAAPPAPPVPPVAPAAGSLIDGGVPDAAPPSDAPPAADPPADEGIKAGAPEKYEDFAMPEDVSFDVALTDEFRGVAKELNLSQEQAQKLVDFQAKNAKSTG